MCLEYGLLSDPSLVAAASGSAHSLHSSATTPPYADEGEDANTSWIDNLLSAPLPADAVSAPPAYTVPPPAPPSHAYTHYATPLAPVTLTLKLPDDAPWALPPTGLRYAAARAFGGAFFGAATAGAGGVPLYALEGSIVPGCTLLLLHALADGAHAAVRYGGSDAAAAALRAALAADDAGGAFLRSRAAVSLSTSHGGGGIAVAEAGRLHARPRMLATPSLPRASPLALLSTSRGEVALLPDGTSPGEPLLLRCLLHGQVLRFERGRESDGAALVAVGDGRRSAALRACGAEGVALLCAASGDDDDADAALRAAAAPPRPLLLTPDAALVAEVAAAEAELLEAEAAGTPGAPAWRRALEGALLALGHALRPGCSPALVARAAASARALGLRHALRRIVSAVEAVSADGLAPATPGRATLLHALALAGDAGAAGATALCELDADAAAMWLFAHDGAGLTPSQLAAEWPAAFGALDAALRARYATSAKVAAAAAAAVGSCAGIFVPTERAATAAALLAQPHAQDALLAAGASADDVDLAVALLNMAAAAAAACDAPPDLAAASAGGASGSAPRLQPSAPLSFAAWLLVRQVWLVRAWALMSLMYHVIRLVQRRRAPRLEDALAPLRAAGAASADGSVVLQAWADALPLFHALIGSAFELALEFAATLALLLPLTPLAPARARAALLRHAGTILALEHAIHLVLGGVIEAALLARIVPGVTVVWPLQVAYLCSYSTLLAHVCWPLPAAAALPLLAGRASLVLGGRTWLVTPPRGVALQVAACVAAGVLALGREAALRPRYNAELAAATAAPVPAGPTTKGDKEA